MSQTCRRCNRIVARRCQSDTETESCVSLVEPTVPRGWDRIEPGLEITQEGLDYLAAEGER